MHQPVNTPARAPVPRISAAINGGPESHSSTTTSTPRNTPRATAAVSRSKGILVPQPGRTPSAPERCPAAHSRKMKHTTASSAAAARMA